jgi:predicted dehydrogenase
VPGRVTLSKTHSLADRLRVIGERGTLEVGENQKRSVTYNPSESHLCHEISPKSDVPSANDDYFRVQLEDFVRAIQTGSEPRVSGEQGLASVVFMENCYQMAAPLSEPWVDEPLERLKEILPSAAQHSPAPTTATVAS